MLQTCFTFQFSFPSVVTVSRVVFHHYSDNPKTCEFHLYTVGFVCVFILAMHCISGPVVGFKQLKIVNNLHRLWQFELLPASL